MKRSIVLSLSVAGVLLLLSASPANAELAREGAWPEDDPKITLDLSQTPRNEAVRKIAEASGLSLAAEGVGTTPIDLHVKDVGPGDALSLALGEGRFAARREGKTIALRPTTAPPAAAAAPTVKVGVDHERKTVGIQVSDGKPPRARDRRMTGQSLRIEKDEIVQDVHSTGGSIHIFGTVQGDVRMTGGPIYVHDGAHVLGDVHVTGGEIQLDDGSIVDGDIRIVGGHLKRAPAAKVGGDVSSKLSRSSGGGILEQIGQAFSASAMLFVFGAVLIALLGQRLETLEREVASRPMRNFAIGVVGLLAFGLTLVAACITVVGIPVAAVGAIAGAFGLYAGIVAALSVVGRALSRHKTDNRYLHLAIGCAVFLFVAHVPWGIGEVATLFLGLVGWGSVLSSRGAGWFDRRDRAPIVGQGPYRTA